MFGVMTIKKLKYLRRKFSEKLELPEDSLGTAPRIQIIGDRVIISCSKKVLKYKAEEIVILCKEEIVTVTGKQLKCVYFYEETVEITGEFSAIGFERR